MYPRKCRMIFLTQSQMSQFSRNRVRCRPINIPEHRGTILSYRVWTHRGYRGIGRYCITRPMRRAREGVERRNVICISTPGTFLKLNKGNFQTLTLLHQVNTSISHIGQYLYEIRTENLCISKRRYCKYVTIQLFYF
jgi:hypothetical protein